MKPVTLLDLRQHQALGSLASNIKREIIFTGTLHGVVLKVFLNRVALKRAAAPKRIKEIDDYH
jgi:hypothetical protein